MTPVVRFARSRPYTATTDATGYLRRTASGAMTASAQNSLIGAWPQPVTSATTPSSPATVPSTSTAWARSHALRRSHQRTGPA